MAGSTHGSFWGLESEAQALLDATDEVRKGLSAFDSLVDHTASRLDIGTDSHRFSPKVVADMEAKTAEAVSTIHDGLPEGIQLLVYRFYLTAVHRSSIVATRFEPPVLASPERSSAVEQQFEAVGRQLDEIIEELAVKAFESVTPEAVSLSATFLWTAVWWVHARQDVLLYGIDRYQDAETLAMLGRPPDNDERLVREIYDQAVTALLTRRNRRRENSANNTEAITDVRSDEERKSGRSGLAGSCKSTASAPAGRRVHTLNDGCKHL